MKIFREVLGILLLLYILFTALVIEKQGDVIETQRTLIKEMTKNPNCVIP